MYFVFDRFELDLNGHQLIDRDADQTLALRPQAFSVLVFLLERAPATVSREQLLNGVWGHTALSASGVSQAIREIRKTLGDDASDPRILATRHGCGYQLIAPVGIRSEDDAEPPALDSDLMPTELERLPETRQRAHVSRQSAWIAAAVALAPLVALITSLMLAEPSVRGGSAHAGSTSWMLSGRGLPRSETATDAWSAGLKARALFDRDEALQQFERAWRAAPDSTSVLLALINAQVDAGEIIVARKYLDHELLKRARLSHRERLELRATVARVAGSWAVAADALQSLADFFPGERQYALWLFEARMHSAPPHRAGEALAALMPTSDPAVALAASRLLMRQGRIIDAIEQTRAALKMAEAAGAEAAGIVARGQLAGLLLAVSDVGSGRAGRQEAQQLLAEVNQLGQAFAARSALLDASIQGFELALEQGDRTTAHAQIAAVCISTERAREHSECARMQGMLALEEGHTATARSSLEQAAQGFEDLGWTERLGETRRIEAELELRLGRVSMALDRLDEAERLHHQIGAVNQLARSATVRGDALAARLNYLAAIEQYRSGLQHFQDIGDRHTAAHTLVRLAALLPLVGDFEAADQARAEAAAIFTALDDGRGLAALDWATALAALRTGDRDAAVEHLASAEARSAALGEDDRRIEALAELVRLHTAGLELQEAHALLRRASELETVNPLVQVRLVLAAADLAMVESDFGAASVLIADARTILAREGSSVQMRRIDLAQARLLLESGQAPAAGRLGRALLVDALRTTRSPAFSSARHGGVETIPEEDRLAVVLLLVQALADQRRMDEARWTLDSLTLLDVGGVSADLGLRLQMLQAYISATATPVERLREVRDLALGQGFRLIALESDALLADALMRNRQPVEAQLLADVVSRQAQASGAQCVVNYLDRLRAPGEL